MKSFTITVPVLILAALLASCDFPSDPPLRTTDVPDTPDTPPVQSGELLPLKSGNQWIYIAKGRMRPGTSPIATTARKLTFREQDYYYLRYGPVMGPAGGMNAFPPLLANDSTGLRFYLPVDPEDTLRLTRTPVPLFHLPYPARPGAWTRMSYSDYSVRLTNRDTLVDLHDGSMQLPCHRYEVARSNRPAQVFYIVPGVCILRVEVDEIEFHTIGWRLH
ncbi:MAG: hypothetical protein RRA94_12380 [Bacteroidota bacterium]|nr:hypothetical protein [Bacteroidota bacterium]